MFFSFIRSLCARFFKRAKRLQVCGDNARALGDWAGAAYAYERALEKVPEDARLRIQAGHMRKEAGDFKAAEAHYLRARVILLSDFDLSLQLGHFYKVVNRPFDALAAYREAWRLEPSHISAHQEYLCMEATVASFLTTRADTLNVDNSALVSLADAARERMDWEVAAEGYEHALEHQPDASELLMQAGHMRKESGNFVAAEAHYLRARCLLPDSTDLHVQLGHFYKAAQRPFEALASYHQALRLDPQNEILRREHDDMFCSVRKFNSGTLIAHLQSVNDASRLTIDDFRKSGLFDRNWYQEKYLEIIGKVGDPLHHFYVHGRRLGYQPGPNFDPHWYLAANPEARHSGLDPFSHYLVDGRGRGFSSLGPPAYEQWVERFDTLSQRDVNQIDAHIASGLMGPGVLLVVDKRSRKNFATALQSLRDQRLKPTFIVVCMVAGATLVNLSDHNATGECILLAKGDPLPPELLSCKLPLIWMDAGVELRAHASYMLVEAATRGARGVYCDEDKLDKQGRRHSPYFKPGPSPELMRHTAYIGACALLHLVDISDAVAKIQSGTISTQELIREQSLAIPRAELEHVPHVLFHDHTQRDTGILPTAPSILSAAELVVPSVTIIIPTRDRLDHLSECLESLFRLTNYPRERMEVVVVNNGSIEPQTLTYLEVAPLPFRSIDVSGPFNFASINNVAAAASNAEVLILLNNDTAIIEPDWLRELVRYAMEPDVAAVGPKLLYEDRTIQHAGIVLGAGVVAHHAHLGLSENARGAYGFANLPREVSAVTGACLAIRRQVYLQLSGLDENLPVAFNDVNLCLAAAKAGYRNIYAAHVRVSHFESATRGRDDDEAKEDRFIREANYARRRFREQFLSDPFYNPNLSLDARKLYEPAFPPRAERPWIVFARERRLPKVLFLADVTEPSSEVSITMSFQASYLANQGWEVIVGAPTLPSFSLSFTDIACVEITTTEAASFAIENEVDLIICHTSNFAGIKQEVGTSIAVILFYHGLKTEAVAGSRGGRADYLTLQLAMPLVDELCVSMPSLLNNSSISISKLIKPGGDRYGRWSAGCHSTRVMTRQNLDWHNKTVILIDGLDKFESLTIYAQLNSLSHDLIGEGIHIVFLPSQELRGVEQNTIEGTWNLMCAADIFWSVGPQASALLRAEAESAGLVVIPSATELIDPQQLLSVIGTFVEVAKSTCLWKRTSAGPGWSDTLPPFRDLILNLMKQRELGSVDKKGMPKSLCN